LPVTEKSVAVVTKNELMELADWERKHAAADKKAADAKRELVLRRIQLAEKVLGIKSGDELKTLSPEQVERKMARRLENGDWEMERNAPDFKFVKTNAGRYPAWAQIYASEKGIAAAERIKSETPLTYSYAVEVTTT
jgi:hypothetical protein